MDERNVAPTVGGGKKAPTGAGITRGGIGGGLAPTVASR
jgi:hypothetical protein